MMVMVMVMSSIERRQRDLDSPGPHHPVLDRGSYPRDEELFDFRHVLQLGSRSEQRRSREAEFKVGVKGEVDCRVCVCCCGGGARRYSGFLRSG